MKLKYIFAFAVSIYAIFVVVACGNKNSNNNEVITLTCPAGTAYYNSGNCYGPNGQIIGNYNNGLITAQDVAYLAETHRNRNLTITDNGVFLDFLQKAHGACNRAHYNGGTANCDAWTSAYFMLGLQSFANQNNMMSLIFVLDYRAMSNSNYSYQLPSIGEFFMGVFGVPSYNDNVGEYIPKFRLDKGVASIINGSKGFEVRAYGPDTSAANRSLIQVSIPNGKILDNTLNFVLSFAGKRMATGTFGRCIYPDCREP